MGAVSVRDRIAAARDYDDFQFTDLEWKSILESLGCTQIELRLRLNLQRAAVRFLGGGFDRRKPSKEEMRDLYGIAKSAKSLLANLNHIPEGLSYKLQVFTMLFGPPERLPLRVTLGDTIDQTRAWVQFKSNLRFLINSVEAMSNPPRGDHPDHVAKRNNAWQVAAQVFEQVTGRRASATEHIDFGAGRKPPDGPFVRFIFAFMAAIPGERLPPTGDQIRGWIRKHRKTAAPVRRAMASKT